MARIWRVKSAEGCVPQDAISAMPAVGISPLDALPGPAVAAWVARVASAFLKPAPRWSSHAHRASRAV